MASVNATAVAQKVIETIGKHRKVKIGEIVKQMGYSASVAKTPQLVTRTKSYQLAISPVLAKIEKERDRILLAMKEKDLSEEKYATLLAGLDILTKNAQLLGGKSTENIGIAIEISETLANKYKQVSNETPKDMLNGANDGESTAQ